MRAWSPGVGLARRRPRRPYRDVGDARAPARPVALDRAAAGNMAPLGSSSADAARRRCARGQPQRRARRPHHGERRGRAELLRRATVALRAFVSDWTAARVSGRVALVTGAARGIGAATVRGLDAEGWSIAGVDRGADDPRLSYALGSRAELWGCAPRPGTVRADGRRQRSRRRGGGGRAGRAPLRRPRRGHLLRRGDRRRRARLGGRPRRRARAARRQPRWRHALRPRRDPGAAAPPRAAERPLSRRRLRGGGARTAAAGRVRRGEGGRRGARARARRRAARHRRDRQRGRARLDRHRDARAERPAVRPGGRGRLRRPAADRAASRARRGGGDARLARRAARRRRHRGADPVDGGLTV